MKSLVRPELSTAALRSSQATLAAVDNSAPLATRPQSTYKSGNVVQTTGAISMGRLDEAMSWYQNALSVSELSERSGDPAMHATYNNVAALYQEMGRNIEAIEWYQRALQMSERSGRTSLNISRR